VNKTARQVTGWILVAVFISTVVLANVLTTHMGFIPVGFGLTATAGTLVAGATLALRDAVQDTLGRWVVVGAILAGAILSFAMSAPFIAIASAVAFLVSELADYGVYTPIRKRSRFGDRKWAIAVAASTVVGAVVDTVLFLGIAFGPAAILPALPGQLVGKVWAMLAFLLIGWAVSRVVLRKPVHSTNP
jgi:uncharacterized PurR-regulated membrane protein YhhQ (DUF165 family)